jgi:quercetin dioxygenase-like cupin family protein
MRVKSTRLASCALLWTAGFLSFGMAAAAQQPAVQSETLLTTDSSWDGVPYAAYPSGQPQLSVLKITIPAHSQLKWHTHPMPNAAYIVSGELTVEEKDGGKQKHFTAGQIVPETVGTVHRGVTGDSPVELIVFYAGVKGMPLVHAAQ